MNARESEELLHAIDVGVRQGVAAALRSHKQAGRSIYVWRDGRVVEIPPDEIPIGGEETSEARSPTPGTPKPLKDSRPQ